MDVIYVDEVVYDASIDGAKRYRLPKCPKCNKYPTYNLPYCPYCGIKLEYENDCREEMEENERTN